MIFADEPYVLHLLAGSQTISALDAAKTLLDNSSHNVNEREAEDNLSPLHIAAAWDNLAMCQLFIHYGADVDALDLDRRKPVDVATGKSRRFLKKLHRKNRKDRHRLSKILSYVFGRTSCLQSNYSNESSSPYKPVNVNNIIHRQSCPALPETPKRKSHLFIDHNDSPEKKLNSLTSSFQTATDSFSDGYETAANEGIMPNEDDSQELKLLKTQFSLLTIDTLKKKLKEKKFSIGPINEHNRKLYEKKLARFEMKAKDGKVATLNKYSTALQRVVSGINSTRDCKLLGETEEREIQKKFAHSLEKDEVSFFCYLLIDPTMLPDRMESCKLNEFIDSVFYIGKGKRSRPLQHLFDASQCRSIAKQKSAKEITEKLRRILDLWNRHTGIISLHVFHNIHSEEAYIREASMIEAIGLENLTNIRHGKTCPKWTMKQTTEYGALLLQKAHKIFCNERCRPIFEKDVSGMAHHFYKPKKN